MEGWPPLICDTSQSQYSTVNPLDLHYDQTMGFPLDSTFIQPLISGDILHQVWPSYGKESTPEPWKPLETDFSLSTIDSDLTLIEREQASIDDGSTKSTAEPTRNKLQEPSCRNTTQVKRHRDRLNSTFRIVQTSKHPKARSVQCSACGRMIARRGNLPHHLKRHGKKKRRPGVRYVETQDENSPNFDPKYLGPWDADGYRPSPTELEVVSK